MKQLETALGAVFEIDWAAPVDITENVVFLAKIVGSSVDSVHDVFKNPEQTITLLKRIESGDNAVNVATYTGYTRYCGFSVDNDGSITVTLKKEVNV